DGEPRDAEAVSKLLINHQFRGAPIIVPHDESAKGKSPETQGKILQRMGYNVRPESFRNPVDNQLNVKRYGLSTTERYNDIERGLIEMNYLFKNGKLKVNKHLWQWFREMRSYSYKYNEVTKSIGYAGSDHCIDASRYSILSLIAMRGDEVYKCYDLNNSRLEGFETITWENTNF
ncbi:phage terminase large subunit family protein, partial [Herbiconiux daphne]